MNFLKYIIRQSIKEVQELDNAMNRIKEINMSNWNGKIKCIKNDDMFNFTSGKIYEVKNGCIKDDNLYNWSNSWNKGYENLNEFNKRLNNNSIFEEVKENENSTNGNCCNSNVLKNDLPNKIPVLCELLNLKPYEKFKIEYYPNQIFQETYEFDEDGILYCQDSNCHREQVVERLINKKYNIIKLPQYQFTESEITIIKALWINNYYYIARVKDGDLYAYDIMPELINDDFYHLDNNCECCMLNKNFFKQIQFGTILDIESELSKLN